MSGRLRRAWIRALREAFHVAWALGGARSTGRANAIRALEARRIFLAANRTQTLIGRA